MQWEDFLSRRFFLKSSFATGVALMLPNTGCKAPGQRAAAPIVAPPRDIYAPKREKLRLAYIATGGMGGSHIRETQGLGITCPCYADCDENRFKDAAEAFPNAKAYTDYREMFDKEHKNFDAVMIGTPDHQHYPATIAAMQLGKHVYTQKPLTHTVWEARELTKAAQRYNLATQMGNQGHAGEGWRLVYEWIHSGALGDVLETHTWSNRPIWPQGFDAPQETHDVPAHLNWDAWLGPAAERPYVRDVYHPFNWRGWWDFGAGALGDMACHMLDGLFWAVNPGPPSAVEPLAMTKVTDVAFPEVSIVRWEFPARNGKPASKAYWYDGSLRPTFPPDYEYGRRLPRTGNLFIGTKASMVISGDYGQSPRLYPEEKMKEIGKPPQMLERSPGHYVEWVQACRGEKPIDYPKSRFAYAGPMSETILLGNVALRVGRRLEWDSKNLRVTNLPEANAFISKEYREGWKLG